MMIDMGSASADRDDATCTPKLCLHSFPSTESESPGLLTPPPRTKISIPFEWEEAPGKPRPGSTITADSSSTARCLELPPRLLSESAKVSNMPSPTTVLEGPYYAGRSLSLREGGSFRSLEEMLSGKRISKEKLYLGSSRWRSFRMNNGSFDLSSSSVFGGGDGGNTQVKITRARRKASLLSLSHASSQVWASIYENLKQVVPWRRGQEKMRKKGS